MDEDLPKLRDVFLAHCGPLSDKWEQYIPIYESEFGPYLERGAPVALLEIGVQNGGSLEIWHKLFPPQSRVVGLDINERCRDLELSKGIELHIGDATQAAFIDGALGETCFDIIIDDGSHRSKDVIASFEILFRRLKPGGIYVIEDLHTSYWPAYGGGFRAKRSSIEWAKNLVDAINADHIKSTSKLRSDERARLLALNAEIARIAFFDSLLVVQKYPSAKQRPFAHLLIGSAFPIDDPVQWIEKKQAESFGNWIVGPAVTAGLKRRIDEKERKLKRQELELKGKEQELKDQEQELARQELELKGKEQALKDQEQELKALRSSTSWKITAPLRRTGNVLKYGMDCLGKARRWAKARRSTR